MRFCGSKVPLTELRPVEGEACSAALGINSKTQVVGLSAKTCLLDAADRHATLWENGRVIDLNTFLPSGADLQQLTDAFNINDRGEIAGLGIPPGCDDEFSCGRVFVLLPCDDEDRDDNCKGGNTEASADPNDDASTSSAITAKSRLTPSQLRERMRAYVYGQNRRFMELHAK